MKTRDIVKWALASFIAVLTIASMTVLVLARADRQRLNREESLRIEQRLESAGTGGMIPRNIETHGVGN